jgi:hypothetical protein
MTSSPLAPRDHNAKQTEWVYHLAQMRRGEVLGIPVLCHMSALVYWVEMSLNDSMRIGVLLGL